MKLPSLHALLIPLAFAATACTSGVNDATEPAEESPSIKKSWLNIDISTGAGTRADADELDKIDDSTDASTQINSLAVYILKDGVVIGAGNAEMTNKDYDTDHKVRKNLKAEIIHSEQLDPEATYTVRAIANIDCLTQLLVCRIFGTAEKHDALEWMYTATDYSAAKGLPSSGMPMSTLAGGEATLTLKATGKDGSETNPYPCVDNEPLVLTRLMAAVDYTPKTGDSKVANNTYPITQTDDFKQHLKAKLVAMSPVNVVSKCNMFKKTSTDPSGLVLTPTQDTWLARVPLAKATSLETALSNLSSGNPIRALYELSTDEGEQRLFYLTENVPSKDNLKLQDCTSIVVTAVLKATENAGDNSTPTELAKILKGEVKDDNGKPIDLVYFDDGTFNSGLIKKSEATANGTKILGPEWHLVQWEDVIINGVKIASGYVVRYIHAIRHGGIDSDSKASAENNSGQPAAAIDGQYTDMEYAVVRNSRYVIKVNSIASLPRPFDPTVGPENLRQDIDIKVEVQNKWNYHRTSVGGLKDAE